MTVKFRGLQGKEDWAWFTARNPACLTENTTGVVAVDGNDKILACCIMDSWTETSCQAHYAIDNPIVLRRGFFEEISKFVFDTAKRMYIYGLVPSDNEKALRLNKKIGFKEVTRLKDAFKLGVDYVILELKKEHCRFNASEGS